MAVHARRLAAVMFTDIVGYTALTQLNETKALELLARHNRLLRPIFPRFRGREIKTMGDSFLIEFESALDATECAVELQRFLREDNARHSAEDRVRVRVGIHIGDIVHADGDVLGDSVNVASRIQPLAEPEGVCVTGPVFELVQNKVRYGFEKLEPKPLKNVRYPPAVYRLILPWSGTAPPLIARPARNRIAVLPLANISPDPADAYFADGMTEELIQVLSGLPGARVIARTSVEPYRERKKPVREIGVELHVDTVLEGSIRKLGDRIRVAVQLVRTETEEPLWSASYDRRLDDIFALQTEIARTVAENLRDRLHADVREPALGPPVVAGESYLSYLKGRSLLRGDRTRAMLETAKRHFEEAVELDERNARAYVGLADAIFLLVEYHGEPRAEAFRACYRLVDTALRIDPNLAEAHSSRGNLLALDYRFSEAEDAFRTALSLNPSYSTAHHWWALTLEELGRVDEAMGELALAEETDPLALIVSLAFVQVLAAVGRLDDARSRILKLGEAKERGAFYDGALIWYSLITSDFATARTRLESLRANFPDDTDIGIGYGIYYALTGEREKAEDAVRRLEALPETDASRENQVATVCAHLGDLDRCFAWLERAFEKRTLGFCPWRLTGAWGLSPLAAPVRSDPRFHDLLERANLA